MDETIEKNSKYNFSESETSENDFGLKKKMYVDDVQLQAKLSRKVAWKQHWVRKCRKKNCVLMLISNLLKTAEVNA